MGRLATMSGDHSERISALYRLTKAEIWRLLGLFEESIAQDQKRLRPVWIAVWEVLDEEVSRREDGEQKESYPLLSIPALSDLTKYELHDLYSRVWGWRQQCSLREWQFLNVVSHLAYTAWEQSNFEQSELERMMRPAPNGPAGT